MAEVSRSDLSAWRALEAHHHQTAQLHMRQMFAEDPARFDALHLHLGEVLFDYSKHRVTRETLGLLLNLAEETGVGETRARMFAGEKVNASEGRAVLHTALRNQSERPVWVNGQDVMPEVRRVLARMRDFCERVRRGAWRGHTGKPITDVVNLGIGGSHLGPQMVSFALTPYADGPRVHFVSNVDGSDLSETMKRVSPERTLFLVASKTFATQETMTNAHTARAWLLAALGDEAAVARHFAALSTNADAVRDFGIDPENMFEFWDWVGGRYSVWSAIGLPVALSVGWEHFAAFLAGAHEADEHFRTAPNARNIPVVMAMLGVWYVNFFGAESHAILPYDHYLEHFADYFQQGDMESNGKGVTRDGQPVRWQTGPVVWGQPGTNGQHAFYQLIHQGTRLVPCDFLAAAKSHSPLSQHHELLLSNFFAQPEALMRGRTPEEARADLEREGYAGERLGLLTAAKTFPGNRPSSSFLYERLSPRTLGTLVALYEHKIFVQGVVWDINSFDQMGVELGKELAQAILPELSGEGEVTGHDSSTNGLINAYKQMRGLRAED